MKRLFTLLLITLATIARGQTVPNGDFESWSSKTYDSPDSGWFSSNPSSISAEDTLTVWKVTGHTGQAVHIQTSIIGTDTLQAYVTNSQGDPMAGEGGVPYSQVPTAITGYYKYNMVGNDTAGLLVIFKKSGSVVGSSFFKVRGSSASVSTWTAFSLPISLGTTPDSVIIGITSSNLLNNNIGLNSGSWIEVDELAFTGPGVTQSIPGGSFDGWSTGSFTMADGWKTEVNQVTSGVSKTTDHYSGSYAIALTTSNEPTQITTGQFSPHQGPIGGLPYTRTTDTLTGYYKYTTSGTDTGMVMVSVSKSGSGYVGGGNFFCMPASSYTYFQIPINASMTPDTLRVDIVSSSWNAPVAGSVLYIDKLQLKSQPLGLLNFHQQGNTLVIYPNPAADQLHIQCNATTGNANATIYDITGRVLMTQSYSIVDHILTIPVGALMPGMYYYELAGNDGTIARGKFLKQ